MKTRTWAYGTQFKAEVTYRQRYVLSVVANGGSITLIALVRGPKPWWEEAGDYKGDKRGAMRWFAKLLKKYRPTKAELLICDMRPKVRRRGSSAVGYPLKR